MKFSRIINYPLGLIGLKIARAVQPAPVIRTDITEDKHFMNLYESVKPFTLVDIERCYALYKSVEYILANKLEGDFVECGVWKGGSCMLIAAMLKQAGVNDRQIWLYDTFSGMTEPGIHDGDAEKKEWADKKINDNKNNWCLAGRDEVEQNMRSTGYPFSQFRFVEGKVEETIPSFLPGKIALLRLDTDWYESTLHELVHLYPLLVSKGVLLIDDYGAWEGARKATDEYFGNRVYLHRLDWTGRLLIKD